MGVVHGEERVEGALGEGVLEVKVYGCRHMYILIPKMVQRACILLNKHHILC